MKNIVKLFGIIALVAVIGFSMAACDNDTSDPVVPASNPEKLRLFNVTVDVQGEAPQSGDFGYTWYNGSKVPLGDVITGTPKAQLSGKRLTLALDAPKPGALSTFPPDFETYGITITPSDVKNFSLYNFFNSAGVIGQPAGHLLRMVAPDGESLVDLVYVDKDVKFEGTDEVYSGYPIEYNYTLKKGWNYKYQTTTGEGSAKRGKIFASRTKPAGAKWIVKK
jgi:hypothetical protein